MLKQYLVTLACKQHLVTPAQAGAQRLFWHGCWTCLGMGRVRASRLDIESARVGDKLSGTRRELIHEGSIAAVRAANGPG